MSVDEHTYFAKKGTECLFACGCDSIVGESIDIDDGKAYQPVACNKCGGTWTDVYELSEVLHLVYPESVEIKAAPTVCYVVCENDSPEKVFCDEEEANSFLKDKKEEEDRLRVQDNYIGPYAYWHIEECEIK